MPDFIDFLPLYSRTEDQIRADFDNDANAGVVPTEDGWVDTRAASFFHMVTQPFVIESARIHDQIATLPAVAFIEFAFGEYLDYHAADWNTERKAAIAATGFATFYGAATTEVTADTQISTEQTDSNVPPIVFQVVNSGTIYGPLTTPPTMTGVVDNTTGSLATGSYYYLVSAYDAAGDTTVSLERSITIPAGANHHVTLSWAASAHAVGYKVWRGTAPTAENQYVIVPTNGLVDDGTLVWTSGTPPVANTTGGAVSLPIAAKEPGRDSNVGPGALTQMVTFNQNVTSVNNPLSCDGGEDVENDADLQQRLLVSREGDGPGRPQDYVKWLLEQPGVQKVQVFPEFSGPGTVGVVVMDALGGALSAGQLAQLQATIDPYPAQGGGVAPINHAVTIMTPAEIAVNIAASVTFRTGYSYDGISNTIPIRQSIIDALTEYFTSVLVGETILTDRIKATIYGVEGILSVTLTTPSGNVSINGALVPPQRAALGTVTLT